MFIFRLSSHFLLIFVVFFEGDSKKNIENDG